MIFTKTSDSARNISTWFERDRQHVRLETPRGRVIFDLWDEDGTQALEDGFMPSPRGSGGWQPAAVAYAKSQGLLTLTRKDRISGQPSFHQGV